MKAMRVQMTTLALVALAAGAGAPVFAQSVFEPPEGCEAFVTIQSRDCTASHLFVCEADPKGFQRRVDLDAGGLIYMGMIDAETQWVESYNPRSGNVTLLGPNPRDAANLSELIETGRDGFDFTTTSDATGTIRHIGEDVLTGEVEVIDGVTLQVTNFRSRSFAADGTLLSDLSGREFIHPQWRTFIAGTRTGEDADGEFTTDGNPVEFAFPGEPGFLTINPKYGCGELLSRAPAHPHEEETSHDHL